MVSSVAMTQTQVHQQVEAVWRIEAARLIASLARIVRDVGLAEEFAQDALVSALEHGREGVPDNPGAWLMSTGKNRALDHLRRQRMLHSKHEVLGQELEALQAAGPGAEVGMRSVMTCCG